MCGFFGVGGVVLRDIGNRITGHQTNQNDQPVVKAHPSENDGHQRKPQDDSGCPPHRVPKGGQKIFERRLFVNLVDMFVDMLGQSLRQDDGIIATDDHVNTKERGHNTDRSDKEGKPHKGHGVLTQACAKCCCRNDRAAVAFKKIGAHARNVTDVIAHVISDHGRIPGVILWDTLFHLTDEIGTYVRRLGIDATANTRKQCDAAGTKAEAGDIGQLVRITLKKQEQQGHPKEAEADHGHAHDRPAAEGYPKTLMQTNARRSSGSNVSPNSHVHPQIAGASRCNRPKDERHRGLPMQKDRDNNGDNRHKDGENLILAIEKR